VSPDGTTATSVDGNQINPVGAGTVNGNNLFHSFDQFNVPASGVIFGTNGSSVDGNSIQNILNRVTGGDPSSIFGAIESSGAFPNANLFLLNPNGIIFGAGASLDIGGSFMPAPLLRCYLTVIRFSVPLPIQFSRLAIHNRSDLALLNQQQSSMPATYQ
jgi:filamentous hemagglutinin family protein